MWLDPHRHFAWPLKKDESSSFFDCHMGRHLLQSIYIKPKLYCLCIFKIMHFCTLWQKVIGTSCFIYIGSPISPWCTILATYFSNGHTVQFPAILPPHIFFLFIRRIPTAVICGIQKGPHPVRWHLCWSNDTPSSSRVPGCDLILIDISLGHLRRMNPHPSSTATWRIVLAILANSQKYRFRNPTFFQRSSHWKVIQVSLNPEPLCFARLDLDKCIAHSFLSIIFKCPQEVTY